MAHVARVKVFEGAETALMEGNQYREYFAGAKRAGTPAGLFSALQQSGFPRRLEPLAKIVYVTKKRQQIR